LNDGEDNFKHTLNGNYSDKQKKLILKKGVYPYEYIDKSNTDDSNDESDVFKLNEVT
jgi:hypothetical protein